MLWKKQVDRAAKNLVLSEMLIETDVNQERRIGTAEAAFTFLSETEHFPGHMQKFSNWGRLEPGDKVIQVRKFEHTQVDSNLFWLTDKEFPVFIENVLLNLDHGDFVSDGAPTAWPRQSSSPRLFGFSSARWWLRIASSRLSAESKET